MVRLSRSGNKPTVIDPALIARIDDLSEYYTAGEVATALNEAGIVHPTCGEFDTNAVVYLLKRFALPRAISGCVPEGIGAKRKLPSSLVSVSKQCNDGANAVGYTRHTITIKRSICMNRSLRIYRHNTKPQRPSPWLNRSGEMTMVRQIDAVDNNLVQIDRTAKALDKGH